MANSGEDPFEEIFKLLVAKLFSELNQLNGDPFVSRQLPAEKRSEQIQNILALANQRWPGILELDNRSRLSPRHLAVCLESLANLSLSDTHLEVLDGAFEYLVSSVAKGTKGQYFTPRHVIDCCVKIIGPRNDETVLDPACGSGGFLVHTLNHVRAENPGMDVQRYCQRNLWGFDFDRRAIRIAKALMLIAGDGASNLFRLNSLLTPEFHLRDTEDAQIDGPRLAIEDVMRAHASLAKGYDIILSNPPFAGEIKETQMLENYSLAKKGRRTERDILFLERCVQLLRPGGRLCIVLPHNKFGSEAWAYAREWLLRQVKVVAVLGLGRNTFLPHTHQKTSILFGVKRYRPEMVDDEQILFLISDKEGKDSRGRIIPRSGTTACDPSWLRLNHDLDDIVTTFREFMSTQPSAWR